MDHSAGVPLTAAAKELGLSYERAKRLVLRGELQGEQLAGRWWIVTRESLARVKKDRAENLTAVAV
jgi:hypothetical protein